MAIKTQKGEETKQKIVRSAQKLFVKKGFEATSVREIVEDVGCAKGTFYLYFETKLDLLFYICNGLFHNASMLIAQDLSHLEDDPFLQIERLLNNVAKHMEEIEGHLRLLHTYEFLKLIQEENLSSSFINDLIHQITQFIKKGIEQGTFREVNPEIYGRIIFSLAHDMLESSILINFPANMQVVKNELMVIIRKILEK